MAVRTIYGYSSDSYNYLLKHEDSYTFSLNLSSEDPVYHGAVTDIKISLSDMKHLAKSYYLVVYVGGTEIGETEEETGYEETGDTTVEHTFNFNPLYQDCWQEALSATGEITILAVNNDDSGNVINVRSGCGCTISVHYDEPTITALPPSISQSDYGQYIVSWDEAIADGISGTIEYLLYYGPDGDNQDTGTNRSTVIDIPASWYGKAIDFTVHATCDGYSSSATNVYTAILPSVAAPTGVTIGGEASFEGEQALLSWSKPDQNYVTGNITYTVFANGDEIAQTSGTSFSVSEEILSSYSGSVSLTVTASVGGYDSPHSAAVTFVLSGTSTVSDTVLYYHNGNFVECLIHYYHDGGLVDCNIKIY